MSSSCRRLRGIFSKHTNAPKNVEKTILQHTTPSKPLSKPPPTKTTNPKTTQRNSQRTLKELVRKVKQNSELSSFRSNFRYFNTVVRRLSAAEQFPLIHEVLDHQKKYKEIAEEKFTVRLINLYGKAGMFDHARKLFDEMPQLKCERTVLSVNALLDSCVASKEFDKFDALLRELPEELSVKPDVVTYNTVIKAFCEMGCAEKAVLVLDQMVENGVEPNHISFNTLLDQFYGSGRFSDGEKIWAMMKCKNLDPNIRSYNAKLRGLVAEKRVSEAADLFDEMRSKGLKPDIFSFNAMIKGFCKDGNVAEAKKWYQELLECGCLPDAMTAVTLLPFLCEKGESSMALEISKNIMKQRLVIDTKLFQIVVDGLVQEQKLEEAVEFVKKGMSNNHFVYKLELNLNK